MDHEIELEGYRTINTTLHRGHTGKTIIYVKQKLHDTVTIEKIMDIWDWGGTEK